MPVIQEIRDVARFEHILNVLFKQELGFFLEQLNLTKYLPLKTRIKKHKFIRKDTKPLRVRLVMEELGATFIKLGQLLSLRPDLIPKEYCDEFRKLQDDVPPFPTSEAKKLVEKELKKPISKLFDYFSEKPVASASVSQVYEARLKNGIRVAVKVQRPNIDKIFKTDIDIMYHFALLLEKKFSLEFVNPVAIVKEFEKYTESELDFLKEARNIDQFYKDFLGSKTVKIPRVYWAFSTPKVLTLEYIDGIRIRNLKSHKNINKKAVVKNLSDCVFKQIFENGFFHADPHSGNVFALKNNSIALLDFGIIGRLGDEIKADITDLCFAVIEGNLHGISESLFNLGFVETNLNLGILEQDIREGLAEYYGASLEQLNFSAVFEKIVEIARKDKVRLPTNFVLLIKSLVTVEGVAAEIDPSFNVIESIKPLATKLIKRRLFDRKRIAKQLTISTVEYGRMFKKLPKQITGIMKKIQEGTVKVQMQDTDIHKLTLELDRSSNRITYGMIIAALIVGSSLVVYLDKGPFYKNVPILALIGYGIAVFMALVLVVSILREK